MKGWTPPPAGKLLLATAAVMLAAEGPLPAADGKEDSWDQYRLLIDRNIFLRYRRRTRTYRPASPRPVVPRAPADSDRDIVLTGIGRRDDGVYVAFFENTVTEATLRLPVGQAVGKGKIKAITLDAVEYEREGTVTRIGIGYTLQGGRFVREIAAPSPPPATRPSGPSTSPTQPATAPARPAPPAKATPSGGKAKDSDVSDILKRMRQRRERELRK